MNKIYLSTLSILYTLIGASAVEKPNIVIIYGDDVGYADVGSYGSKLIPTPNIDALATQGLMFTDGHCTASTCTPSRFSLLTGIHGFRHGVRILPPNAPMKIKPGMYTMPQMLKKAGYQTAVIGKWHLGIGSGKPAVDWNGEVKPGPLEIGFDYSFLLPSTNDRVPCVYLENHRVVNLDPKDPLHVGKKPEGFKGTEFPDGKKDRSAMTYYPSTAGHDHSIINGIGRIGYQWGGKSALWNDETMADEFINQTKKYLAKIDKTKPFFLYFASQDIHVPRTPHPRFKGKTTLGYRGDAMVQLDWSTGAIVAELEKHGLTENTIVIFSSDNGPVYGDGYADGARKKHHNAAGPYRGGKYQIYEAGTRVPFIIKWPKKIKQGSSKALVSQIDLLSSFASLVGVELAQNEAIDSRNTLSAFLGESKTGLPYLVEEAKVLALRRGPWKYIMQKKGDMLFNLEDDIAEKKNLAERHPDKVASMKELLLKIRNGKEGIRHIK